MSRVLILGGTGMLGSAIFRLLASDASYPYVWAAVRTEMSKAQLPLPLSAKIVTGFDATNLDNLLQLFAELRPAVVINCVGLVKQRTDAGDPLLALPLNAILPHRLARLCGVSQCRLIHVSTDCVYSGTQGNYAESDESDAKDLYGKSKFLGEVSYPHAITLRTSIVGHEVGRKQGLIDWFLSQQHQVQGYSKAIFSGLPTIELATIIRDVVIPKPELSGVFHVASEPISKYDLLALVAQQYGKTIAIVPDDSVRLDRSLCSKKFEAATGYKAPPWPELVRRMHAFK